jgi:hypothetical protein
MAVAQVSVATRPQVVPSDQVTVKMKALRNYVCVVTASLMAPFMSNCLYFVKLRSFSIVAAVDAALIGLKLPFRCVFIVSGLSVLIS